MVIAKLLGGSKQITSSRSARAATLKLRQAAGEWSVGGVGSCNLLLARWLELAVRCTVIKSTSKTVCLVTMERYEWRAGIGGEEESR